MSVGYKTPAGADVTFKARTDTGEEVQAVDLEQSAIIGAVNESAPGSDTASSGLNGRLQRIAQRLTTLIGTTLGVKGGVAHDSPDADAPVKAGYKAIAHGSNPTAVAAGDVTDGYASRAGVPFTIGGHPNVVTLKHTTITTAVTDAAMVSVSAGSKIVVTRITATLDNASTVFPTVLIGFGAANTPTTTGVLVAHGGVPAGGGFSIGDGSGILGVGGDGEDLRVTTTGNATGNGLQICASYYTVDS